MATNTTNYNLIKPAVNDPADQDLWGGYWNENADTLDSVIKSVSDVANGATVTKTANYTVISNDRNKVILVDCTSGDITIDADATLGNGFEFKVIKTDSSANSVIFDPTASQTVNGQSSYEIMNQYGRASFISNGTLWFVSDENSFATLAQTLDGSATNLSITPAGFAGNKSLAEDGYYKLPSGLIIQWGLEELPIETVGQTTTITFPTAFTTAVYSITTSSAIATRADNHNFVHLIGDPTLTNFVVTNQYVSGGNVTIKCRWMALGK